MSTQRQIPGGPFVNETSDGQRQIPGRQYLNESGAAGPAGIEAVSHGLIQLTGSITATVQQPVVIPVLSAVMLTNLTQTSGRPRVTITFEG